MSKEDCLNGVLPLNWVAKDIGWTDVGLMQRLEREGVLIRRFGKRWVAFDDYVRLKAESKRAA